MLFTLALACRSPAPEGVPAIFDADRPEHYLDLPFPNDALVTDDGGVDLQGFPAPGVDLAASLTGGWATRLEMMARGWGNNSPVYFRFEGPLELPEATNGEADDPVVLVNADTGERHPLLLRFIEDAAGDPFYGDNTLALVPAPGAPLRSGGRYVAAVMQSAGAAPPDGYALPAEAQEALALAGVEGVAAVSTAFTVQDATGELAALFADVDARLPDFSGVSFRRVVHLEYAQAETDSGNAGTRCTVTYEDGETSETWLAALEGGDGDHAHDLLSDWPMAVYEARVPVLSYQGLEDRPYMSPGLAHLTDFERYTGWITFQDGAPPTPEADETRVVVSIPLGEDGEPVEGAPVMLYDHGTGGHAYNSVQRRSAYDDGRAMAEVLAAAGVAVVGRDAPLYGGRYPLIEEGYGASLGFYNIVNLPAFRDNQRQTAVEGHLVTRFVQTALNQRLPGGSVDPDRLGRFGHSLGSVTANLGLSVDHPEFEGALLSGSGGVFTYYFLDTGLLGVLDLSLLEGLFALVGADPPDEVTPATALGAVLGLPEEAWDHVDRFHPALALFQWTMDPSDPMSVARDEALPAVLLTGVGDWQVPNHTSEALAASLPDGEVALCEASWDYDPHFCLHREDAGRQILADWLADTLSP